MVFKEAVNAKLQFVNYKMDGDTKVWGPIHIKADDTYDVFNVVS